jgi:hypothetical protein
VNDLRVRVESDGDHENYPIGEVLAHYGWDGQERGWTVWRKVHCPFHIDRTASGAINHDLNAYRCFSCDAAGNSVTLVMKVERLEANEAVEFLQRTVQAEPSKQSAAQASEACPWERSKPRKQRLPWEPGWWT